MSQNNPKKNQNTDSRDYYKLNTKAIDKLVNADKMEIPQDKKLKDPAKKYRSDFLDRIPAPVKALFVKFWFNGAVCYFIFWGLGEFLIDHLDTIVILSLVLGMVNDILVDNILRFIETVPSENAKFMMFPKKKFWTFFTNIIYAFIVLNCVIFLYEIINIALTNILHGTGQVYLGVEPILFGLFYMGFDLLFVGMKNLFFTIIEDAKYKVNKQ